MRVQLTNVNPFAVPSTPPLNSSGQVLSPSTLSITWQPPALEGQNGIITSYTVRLIEQPTDMIFTYQRGGSHTEIFITNLHPYYGYSCSVAAATSVGLGPYSAPFTLITHQDGQCTCLDFGLLLLFNIIFHTAPSSPPQNVSSTAADSTSVQLTWIPPESSGQNGIIQHYLISVTETETTRQFQLTSSSTSATVTSLHPYYTYTFSIAAVTVGQGPHSEEISVQTLEDGGYNCQ